MADLEDRVSKLENKVDRLDDRVYSLERQVSALTTKIDYLIADNRDARSKHDADMRALRSELREEFRELRNQNSFDVTKMAMIFTMLMSGGVVVLSIGTIAAKIIRSIMGG